MKWCRTLTSEHNQLQVVDTTTRDPATCFHPSLAREFIQCPDEVENGWYKWTDGTFHKTFEPYWRTLLSRIEFLTLFTLQERAAIREAAKTDAIIEDILGLVAIAEIIDMTDKNTIDGLDYIANKGLITAERCAEIKKGIYVEGDK